MLKKLRIPLSIGDSAYFSTPMDGSSKERPFVTLEDFKVMDGRIEWTLVTNKGQLIVGRVKDQQKVPIFDGMWVAVSIPVTLHYKMKGLALDFIFGVPAIVDISINKNNE